MFQRFLDVFQNYCEGRHVLELCRHVLELSCGGMFQSSVSMSYNYFVMGHVLEFYKLVLELLCLGNILELYRRVLEILHGGHVPKHCMSLSVLELLCGCMLQSIVCMFQNYYVGPCSSSLLACSRALQPCIELYIIETCSRTIVWACSRAM